MFQKIQNIIRELNVLSHLNEGITVCTVKNQNNGFDLMTSLLEEIVDRKTALYLSGGKTPKGLYEKIASQETLIPGAVGFVDERYGEKNHPSSNEKMIRETGLVRYLEIRDVPFYPILTVDKGRKQTAEEYDKLVRSLNTVFPRSVGILGIGADGHTAGIAGNRKDFKNPLFDRIRKNLLVSEFDDPTGPFRQRVTMTFLGLSMLDVLLVLVFGEDKKDALEMMFSDGSEEEIPARFYKRPEIAKKTLLITDQRV